MEFNHMKMIRKITVFALVACVFVAGEAHSGLDGKVIGGKPVNIESFPYQVSLQDSVGHICGGSIVSADYVLTAGHCAEGSKFSYRIRAGSSNKLRGGSIHRVKNIIIHSEFDVVDEDIPIYDIALMKVTPPFTFDETRAAIPLFTGVVKTGSIATVSGWGLTESNLYPKKLQAVNIPIISREECKEAYERYIDLPKGQICAALPEGGKDSCQGDSGGPLVINGRLAGIVSWGIGCAEEGNPGVYTEVDHYLAWIRKYVK